MIDCKRTSDRLTRRRSGSRARKAQARRNPLVWLREIIDHRRCSHLALLRALIIQVFWIPSPSMRNTLRWRTTVCSVSMRFDQTSPEG